MKQCDGSKTGPWYIGFDTKAQAIVFVAQVGEHFPIELDDNTYVILKCFRTPDADGS